MADNKCPTKIREHVFPSVTAAAEHFGATPSAISMANRRGRLNQVGMGSKGPGKSRKVSIAGRSYRSMAQASRDLGFHEDYLSTSLRLGRKSSVLKVAEAALAKHTREEGRR